MEMRFRWCRKKCGKITKNTISVTQKHVLFLKLPAKVASSFSFTRKILHIKCETNHKNKERKSEKMDKKELFKTSSQNGVTMYIDKGLNAVVDMDVEDWVTEIEFNSNVEMYDCDKKFPNVEKLIIGPTIYKIDINNKTFPGVKHIDSNNIHYISGKYLVYASSHHIILKNVFSPDENDTIDMSFINKIAPYAFYGCKCTNLINFKNNFAWQDIEESTFAGSAFEKQPFVNGVKMVNHIVIDIDQDADKIILPDTKTQKVMFSQDVDLGVVKEMVIHNPDSIIAGLRYDSNLPEKLTLEVDSYIRPEDILALAKTKTRDAKYIPKFSIKSPHYVEIDDVIYTKDINTLIVGSAGLRNVEVPEGVEKITDFAFCNSEIESIKLPDSVKKIGDEAFSHCYNLKEINLGDGVKQLGNYVFSWDESLMAIELPSTIQEVGIHSFYKSGIKNIILNDGLKSISQNAFSGTHIEKLYIPESVKHIGNYAISKNTKEIVMPVFLEDIVQGIRRTGKINHLDHTSHIVRLQCGDKYAYLPRYVYISKFADLTKTVTDFFTDFCEERPEFWKYAEDTIDKEDLALLEYSDFNVEKAKQYLKKNSKKIALRLIENKNEENLVKLLKIDIVSKQLLEILLEKAEEMPTARAYILEMLGNTKTNKSFSI